VLTTCHVDRKTLFAISMALFSHSFAVVALFPYVGAQVGPSDAAPP
jgi:hypothetical protein